MLLSWPMWLYASFPLLSVWCVQVYNGLSINIIAFPSFSMHLASVLTTKSLHFLKLMMHFNFYLLPFLVSHSLKTSPCTSPFHYLFCLIRFFMTLFLRVGACTLCFLSTLNCPPFLFTTHCNFELAFPAFCSCFSGFPFRIPYNFSMLAFELCFFLTLFLQ